MKLKKRRVSKKICAMLGIIGAGAVLAAGVLMLILRGPVNLLQAVGFAFTGGMLLFTAAAERGDENRRRRVKLVLLFAALMLSYLRLPPLDLLEALVVPLYATMYRGKGDWPFIGALWALEAGHALARMLDFTGFFGWAPVWLLGALTVAVGLGRGAVLLRLYLRLAKQAPPPPALEDANRLV